MNYEKLTFPKFKEKLEEGFYKNRAGANRAIGKAAWSPEEKAKAQALTLKALPEATKAKPKGKRVKKEAIEAFDPVDFLKAKNLHQSVTIIAAAAQAVDALAKAKAMSPQLDIREAQSIIDTLSRAIHSMDTAVRSTESSNGAALVESVS